jgi:hypothetical protein
MADLVFDLLAKIRQRPALYLGRRSAEALWMYLGGYTDALGDHTDYDFTRYVEFINGLYAKYGRGGGGHSWAWVLGHTAGSDADGFDLFFSELDLFHNS